MRVKSKMLRTYVSRRGDSRIARFSTLQTGFTLVEIVVTIVVMTVAFTSILMWMVNANRNSVDPLLSLRAAELGQSYLEEILAKRFDENTSSGGSLRCDESGQPACSAVLSFESGETRTSFDDVDDYNGLDDNGAVDPQGNPRTEYNHYRVRVNVMYAGGELGLNANEAKRIDVSITHNGGGLFVFSAYRGNF